MSQKIKYPSGKDLERNRLLETIEGCAGRLLFNLTSGAFLVGFLKYMGASDSLCGYILAIPVLAAGIQFLSPITLESLPLRKTLITVGGMVHRFLVSALIFIPFLPIKTNTRLWITFIIFFISYMSFYFVSPAISNMFVSFVPQNIRGSYFGRRESYMLITSTIVTLALGRILDIFTYSGNELKGYIILYVVVFILTLINALTFLLMKEVPLAHSKERMKISEIFTLPLRNKRFVRYFIMLIIWNIASQVASAYFSVYLKSDLNLNYTTITTLSLVNSLVYIYCARKWGKFADKNGWSKTTMITVGILCVCHAMWFFALEGAPFILVLLTIAHITGGIAWSGINIAFFNMQFDYTPDEKRTVYIGFSSAASGVTGFIAASFGSQLVGLFGNNKIYLSGIPFDIKQFLFLSSSILLFICSFFIKFFMKPNGTNKNEEETNNV